MRRDNRGVDLDNPLVAGDGLIQAALGETGIAQAQPDGHIVGHLRRNHFQLDRRFVDAVQMRQHAAQFKAGLAQRWIGLQRLAQKGFGLVHPTRRHRRLGAFKKCSRIAHGPSHICLRAAVKFAAKACLSHRLEVAICVRCFKRASPRAGISPASSLARAT